MNTGGVPLNVFELLTATFAGDQAHQDFRLKDDWEQRQRRLAAKPVLAAVENTDFLQAVALLASRSRREQHLTSGRDPAQAPGITCKRRDILRLTLAEYLRFAPQVEDALLWAAGFLGRQRVFRAADLPYQSQLVPLAAIRAVLGLAVDTHAADKQLCRWYWSGVLGELYGGTIETHFARDLEQVVPWIRDHAAEPSTVAEANFQASRLLTLRTRNSAAYKGVFALLMGRECLDWAYRQPLNMANFLDLNVDIHHIFPTAWCDKNGVDHGRRESIVNKTALSATTNRKIGGASPTQYLKKVEATAGIAGAELDAVLATHLVDPQALRLADFDTFFAHRRARLLELIGHAMGKPVVDTDSELPSAFLDEADELADTEAGADAQESDEAATTPPAEPHPPTPASAPPDDPAALKRSFHAAMVELYRRAKDEANYPANLFLRMVSDLGGLAAAQKLLHATAVSDGFTRLWERGRLDLTVEATTLQPQFEALFTPDELDIARRRLNEYGYRPG